MADPVQKPQASKADTSTFQRMLDKRHEFYSFVGKTYGETIMSISRNPKKAFWIGATVTALAFGAGFKSGNHASSNDIVMNASRTIALVQNQNIAISNKLDEMAKNYADLKNAIEVSNKQIDVRLATLENKVQWKQAADEGEKHVTEVQKKQHSKWNPLNWFKTD